MTTLPGAPNVLMTATGVIRFSAVFGDPFLPLEGSDTQLCGYLSTGDPSCADPPGYLAVRLRDVTRVGRRSLW